MIRCRRQICSALLTVDLQIAVIRTAWSPARWDFTGGDGIDGP